MALAKLLKLPNTALGIRIKAIAVYNLYTGFLTTSYKKFKHKTTKFPTGLRTIIENNHIIDSSLTEIVKELTFRTAKLLASTDLQKFLWEYDFSTELRRTKIINDLKRFRLPFALSVLVIPYMHFLIVSKIIFLLAQNTWNKESSTYARMLVRNLQFISSTETKDIWLELCYLNTYLINADKTATYFALSNESKAFIQSSLHRTYKLNTSKFVFDFKKFQPETSALSRVDEVINRLYKKYILPYIALFLLSTILINLVIFYLFNNLYFLLLSLPLTLLTAYEFSNSAIHPYIPPRKTLSLNPKITTTTATVAACIPFIVSSTLDISRIRTEMERLKNSNASYEYIKYFILLDFADSFDIEHDKIADMKQSLEELCLSLNKNSDGKKLFYYFLRQSVFSARQKRYMGWERKRGKIVELIQYLYNEPTTSTIYSNYTEGNTFTYLFIIDEGSHVSKNIIKELLLRAENINNQPVISDNSHIVRQGYAIFQPRISSKQNFNKTFFQALFNRFEKYHTYSATEDITFSIFGEYYFQGKGLINIDIYRQVCIHEFPDDILLSHDLIEGSYLRVAHVDTCTIFEPFPNGFDPYLQRINRWMRGDMNSILWLFPSLKQLSVRFASKDVGLLAKIRITINLLNVLKSPLLVLAPLVLTYPILGLLANWLISQIVWIFSLFKELTYFLFKKHSISFKFSVLKGKIDYWRVFEFLSLPIHAANAIHAITTSLVRLFVTKNHTLTWITSRRSDDSTKTLSSSFILKLSLLLGIICIINVFYGLILIATTAAAVSTAMMLNRKIPAQKKLPIQTVKYLSKVARLTWNFFEKYVSAETSYLPPDNVTKGKASNFTSITNIGFYFLSLVSAHKLGFISRKRFLHYFKRSYLSLTKLPRYQGHFYNWYDVTTLRNDATDFISSVDSGNFYACMVCVKQYLKKFKGTLIYTKSIEQLLSSTKFAFFINKFDQLSIGYSVNRRLLSKDNYDHFASESRLAVYISIASENISENAWGCLLRPFNKNGALLSWGGTVFEYLLPQIFLKTYPKSLSTNGFQNILTSNLKFSAKYHLPWGLSESLYVNEATKAYEYKPIGISMLSRDPLQVQRTTVAPYATSLMLPVNLEKTLVNFAKLERYNLLTEYGFYEAITFSKTAEPITIDSYMAHHQGMILASITNALSTNIFVRLFNSYATIETVDYLLDEDPPGYPEITDEKSLKFSISEE